MEEHSLGNVNRAVMRDLSDEDLERRLSELVGEERRCVAAVLAHLIELDTRRIWEVHGYASLFQYCTIKLGYSESAAGKRIYACRAAGRYPVILDWIREGRITLTTVVVLHRHLTDENHIDLLTRAAGKTRVEVETLVAAIDPGYAPRDRIKIISAAPALDLGSERMLDKPLHISSAAPAPYRRG